MKRTQVKTIMMTDRTSAVDSLNKWLSEHTEFNIVNISFRAFSAGGYFYYHYMIVYEEGIMPEWTSSFAVLNN